MKLSEILFASSSHHDSVTTPESVLQLAHLAWAYFIHSTSPTNSRYFSSLSIFAYRGLVRAWGGRGVGFRTGSGGLCMDWILDRGAYLKMNNAFIVALTLCLCESVKKIRILGKMLTGRHPSRVIMAPMNTRPLTFCLLPTRNGKSPFLLTHTPPRYSGLASVDLQQQDRTSSWH